MKIVLTHHNPDFDALSSAVAAALLYRCDQVILSSNTEGNVSEYLDRVDLGIEISRMNKKELEDMPEEKIELAVVTDCKLKNRLGYLNKILSRADKVIVFDHHQSKESDIGADEMYFFPYGATTTILVNRIREENIPIDPEQATLLLMGIYEDTGFLSFNTTKSEDLRACAYLLDAGADLSGVPYYIKRDMSKEQVFLLNELLMNMTLIIAEGVYVGVSSASFDEYVEEISFLAHKIIDMENLDALFILVRLGDRIVLVGRSKTESIDASEICYHFGGGGHPAAASSIIKDRMLPEAFDTLKNVIKDKIKPTKNAESIMTYPVKCVSFYQTFDEALSLFMKYNLNMMPVVKEGATVGIISRKDILQGIKHGLSDEPVNSIMQIEFEKVNPDTPYYEVEDIILGANQKIVPVEKDGILVGVITRTDLLRLMREDMDKTPGYMKGRIKSLGLSKTRNLSNVLKDRLPEKYFSILEEVGMLSDELRMNAYIVGGFVRDLLMRNKNFDVDIVVEGDATVVARTYAGRKGAKVSVHDKFKTAVVILNGDRIDFATARTEYYDFPAAAPEVESSSIKNDLYRRDFSINSLAVQINNKDFGKLIDFFGGQKDIKDKKIRVLHNLSFVDDPSRVFRAIRFAVRFGFEIGPHTKKLIKHSVNLNLIERIAGVRLFQELKYILSEDNYIDALKLLDEYDLFKYYSAKEVYNSGKLENLENLEKIYSWYTFQFSEVCDEIYKSRFCVLFSNLTFKEVVNLGERFNFSGKMRDDLIKGLLKTKNVVLKITKTKEVTPAKVYRLLNPLSNEYIFSVGALLSQKDDYLIKDYFTKYRNTKLLINGNDLKKLGYKPSKLFGVVLEKLLDLKLDGYITNKEDELNWAKKLFREHGADG